jgi:hypothetical protein
MLTASAARSAWPGSCASVAQAWPAAITSAPSSMSSNSFLIPSDQCPTSASIAPATRPAGWMTAACVTWAGWIFRSRFVVIELNPARSKPGWRCHPALAGSVVIAREERPGDHRLVAYCLPREDMPAPDLLREFLREHLPDYMVPQHFVELDAIPVLPNGKIDRSRLPSAAAQLAGGTPTCAPAQPVGAQNLAALAGGPRGGALRHR